MSIEEKRVTIPLGNKDIRYYEGLGYKIPKYETSNGKYCVKRNSKITIDIKDLLPNSNFTITAICDCCGNKSRTTYSQYNKCTSNKYEYLCYKCAPSTIENISKMSNKVNAEDAIKLIEELGGRLIEVYSDKIFRTRDKIKILDSEGYYRFNNYNKIKSRKNFGCQPFSPCNPYAIENMKLFIMFNNLGSKVELVSENYTSVRDNLLWKCKIHDELFERNFGNFKKGQHGCSKCKSETIRESKAYSMDDLKILIKDISPNVKISGKYINSFSIMSFECKICGHIWDRRWTAFKAASRCPECRRIEILQNTDGYYCPTRAEELKDKWINIDAIVYAIECFDDYENFYKIGITTKGIEGRFNSSHAMPYKYRKILRLECNLYDAIYIEDYLHEINSSTRYLPNIYFSGHTECFNELKLGKYKHFH